MSSDTTDNTVTYDTDDFDPGHYLLFGWRDEVWCLLPYYKPAKIPAPIKKMLDVTREMGGTNTVKMEIHPDAKPGEPNYLYKCVPDPTLESAREAFDTLTRYHSVRAAENLPKTGPSFYLSGDLAASVVSLISHATLPELKHYEQFDTERDVTVWVLSQISAIMHVMTNPNKPDIHKTVMSFGRKTIVEMGQSIMAESLSENISNKLQLGNLMAGHVKPDKDKLN